MSPVDRRFKPKHLCNTDIISEISAADVRSLAFVFACTDDLLRRLNCVANAYCVSSFYSSREHKIFHRCGIVPFPSTRYPHILPSCLPSSLNRQVSTIREFIQDSVRSRSLKRQCFVRTTIPNIDYFTWEYLRINGPVGFSGSSETVAETFLEGNEVRLTKETLSSADALFPVAASPCGCAEVVWSICWSRVAYLTISQA